MDIKNDLTSKKIIIYGVDRVQKDFRYIFDQLKIEAIVSDESKHDSSEDGIPIYSADYLEETLTEQGIIIICHMEKEKRRAELELRGMKYGIDFLYADDLFFMLDFPLKRKVGNRKIAVWGTGKSATDFVKENTKLNISCYLDNNIQKKNTLIDGIKVLYPNDITINEWEDLYVIVASTYYSEIRTQLSGYGLTETDDFIRHDVLKIKPSDLLKKTIYDNSNYALECYTMFNTYEVADSGKANCCCTTFVEISIGNLIYESFEEIWYSNIHKVLCLSTVNRTYSFCNKNRCPLIMDKVNKLSNSYLTGNTYRKLEEKPTMVGISIDSTCNLACITCRDKLIAETGDKLKNSMLMADKLITETLPNVNFWIMAGNGEIFTSQVYKKIYLSKESRIPQRFRILSNGTLFNEHNWNQINENRTGEIMLSVSIDAVTKETYGKIRCHGNFNRLKDNMLFASQLRKDNKLSYFQLNFVVQRENYKEMIDFVKWGKELSVDKIFFTKILNWGTYSEDEFNNISMMTKEDTPKKELAEILNDPIMQDSIVDLGTINWQHNKGKFDKVESFYEWEIDQWKRK